MNRRLWSKLADHKKGGVIDFFSKVAGISPGEAKRLIITKGEVFDSNSLPPELYDRFNNERVMGISGSGSATEEIGGLMKEFYGYTPHQQAVALKAQADMDRLNARVTAKEKAKASSSAPVKTVNLKDIPADLPLDPQTQIAVDQDEAVHKLLNEKLNSLSNNKDGWEDLLLYGTAGLTLAGGGAAIGKATEPSEEEVIAAYLAQN